MTARRVRSVPIRGLPPDMIDAVHQRIRLYAVTMVIPGDDGVEGVCCSGTFAHDKGMAGIVTAGHVWRRIKEAAKLTLLVGGRPYEVDTRLLRAFGPAQGRSQRRIGAAAPDLTFIRLPDLDQRAIEAKGKVFYSLSKRRTERSIVRNIGVWVVAGSPQALVDRERRVAPSLLYDTDIGNRVQIEGWDYLLVNLNLSRNPKLPRNLRGVSGGGIWRVTFQVSKDRKTFVVPDLARDVILAGVAFYQTGIRGRRIIGHGPTSLYQRLGDHFPTARAGAKRRRDHRRVGDMPANVPRTK